MAHTASFEYWAWYLLSRPNLLPAFSYILDISITCYCTTGSSDFPVDPNKPNMLESSKPIVLFRDFKSLKLGCAQLVNLPPNRLPPMSLSQQPFIITQIPFTCTYNSTYTIINTGDIVMPMFHPWEQKSQKFRTFQHSYPWSKCIPEIQMSSLRISEVITLLCMLFCIAG